MLSSVFLDDDICLILLPVLGFPTFYRYTSSREVLRKNTRKRKGCGARLVEEKEDGGGDERLIADFFYQI